MVVRRTSYPQVEPHAAGSMTRAVAVVTPTLELEAAARVARRRGATLLLARVGAGWAGVTPATLEQALVLGLHAAPLASALWGAPALSPRTPEVALRRTLGPATPFAVVVDGGRPVGAALREPDAPAGLPRSAAAALGRLPAETRALLQQAGALGVESGAVVAAVGGFARDLLLDRPAAGRRDLDIAVEGDGRHFARRLAAVVGGTVREHEAFLTATVTLPDGRGETRIDVATARRETYRRPGALPVVEPATLDADLARRDFSINALAIRLDGSAWGQVLDPTGGLDDLARRRVRVLHPLSFVEDPTRVFRAVRFATRLGFRIEPTTRRLMRAATGLDVYAALSGDRLLAEVDAIWREPAPAEVLAGLGRAGAFRLGRRTYRFTPAAAARVERVAAARQALALAPETVRALTLLALSQELDPEAAEAWAGRLGLPSPGRAALARARREGPPLAATLGGARRRADAYAQLRGVPELVAAWAYVLGPRNPARRHVAAHLRHWRHVRPLLTGDDLHAMGLAPGPLFGRLLARLQAAQVAGRLTTRAAAAAWVRRALTRSESRPHRRGGVTPTTQTRTREGG
jgi:tRNA nucleotidyltransferase (CCA-adding enzyme)